MTDVVAAMVGSRMVVPTTLPHPRLAPVVESKTPT